MQTLAPLMTPIARGHRGRHAAPAPEPTLRTDGMRTTSLKELNAAASLLTRVDRKYLVPADAAQAVVDAIAPRARVLEIDGERAFSYASTYFDTPDLDCFYTSARKRRRKFKVRTRSYLDSGLCFLEVKTCGSRGATVKERLKYRIQDHETMTSEGRGYVADRLIEAGIAEPAECLRLAEALRPVMSTTYHRTTLHLPDDDARATIDSDLEWTALTDEGTAMGAGLSIPMGAFAVIETKNPATPAPTDRSLWAAGHRPAKISKYATGMALLHPELPANKWHRVMTHELDGAQATCDAMRQELLGKAA